MITNTSLAMIWKVFQGYMIFMKSLAKKRKCKMCCMWPSCHLEHIWPIKVVTLKKHLLRGNLGFLPFFYAFFVTYLIMVLVGLCVDVCFCVDIRLILVMPMTLWIFVLVNLSTNVFCCLLFDYTMRSTRICALSEQVHAQRAWATGKACKCMLSAHRQLAKLACCANPKNVSIL